MNQKNSALRDSLYSSCFAAVILLLAIACHAGGYLHWESSAFLLNYTADRPLLNIIFDPQKNDWGLYQCRELSYFFDYLDAQIVFALLKAKLTWFISLSAIIFSLAALWFQQYAGRLLFPRLGSIFFTLHGTALALLPVLTGNLFFRSSKYLVFAGSTFLVFGTALKYARKKTVFADTFFCSVAALVTVFSDRQGIFFVTAFTGVLSVMQFFHYRKSLQKILCLLPGIIIFNVFANLYLVPQIVHAVNKYQPDFSYQKDFAINHHLLSKGLQFFAANTGNFFTGFSTLSATAVAGIFLTAVIFLLLKRHRHLPWWLFPGAVVSVVICCGIMVLRHPPLLDEDVIFSNYFLPSAAILTFFYFAALENLPERFRKWSFLLPILAVFMRIYPYLYPEMLFRDDKYQKVYQDATIKLKYALENPDCDYRLLTMPYRMERLVEKLRNK